MDANTRRDFLRQALGATAFAVGTPLTLGCESVPFSLGGEAAPAEGGATARGDLAALPIVDVHCHIFNANDLSLSGFLSHVIVGDTGLPMRIVAETVQFILRRNVLDYAAENRKLDELLARGGMPSPRGDDDPTNEEFRELLDELELRVPDDFGALVESELSARGDGEDAAAMSRGALSEFLLIGPLGRLVDWAKLMRRPRYEIAAELMSTYPEVSLFTPALVDMDRWLSDRPRTLIPAQIGLYEKICRLTAGQIHPLVAFDPLREAQYRDIPELGSLYWVKQAVQERGFVGVKLYPPMGFRADGNAELPGDYGTQIDAALDALFEWCEREDVPVTAHCADSNEASDGAGERASPEYWARALERYPKLHLNLSHFGGNRALVDGGASEWAKRIAALTGSDAIQSVYADIGYHDAMLGDSGLRRRYRQRIQSLLAAHPKLESRLVYGSDWQMIVLVKDAHDYMAAARREYARIFDETQLAALLGGNALRLYGLHGPDTPARERMLRFYERHGMARPAWWQGDWALG